MCSVPYQLMGGLFAGRYSEFEGPLLPDFGEFERPLAASRLREMFYGAYAEYGIINLKAKYMLLNKSIDLYHHVFTVIVRFSQFTSS